MLDRPLTFGSSEKRWHVVCQGEVQGHWFDSLEEVRKFCTRADKYYTVYTTRAPDDEIQELARSWRA